MIERKLKIKHLFLVWVNGYNELKTFFSLWSLFCLLFGSFKIHQLGYGKNPNIWTAAFTYIIWATSWENLFLQYANNKGTDQPVHQRSLISAFVVCCLDSIIPPVSISKMSSLCLASVAVQTGLCLTWSQTPKTGFLVTKLIFNGAKCPKDAVRQNSKQHRPWSDCSWKKLFAQTCLVQKLRIITYSY